MSKEHREKIRQAAIARHAARKAAEDASPPPAVKAEPPVVIAAKPAGPAETGTFRGHLKPEGFVPGPPAQTGVNPAYVDAPPAEYSLTTVDPSNLFKSWLGSPVGRNVSDIRMPSDTVRLGIDLDDRLRKAFLAGFNAGRELS